MLTTALMVAQRGICTTHSTSAHRAIRKVALHFAWRLTRPPLAQLRSMEPNSGWNHSQRYRRGELRAAAQPAMRMNTVLGRPGTTMPITPIARQSAANTSKSQRASAGRGACPGTGGSGSDGGDMPAIVQVLPGVMLQGRDAAMPFAMPCAWRLQPADPP